MYTARQCPAEVHTAHRVTLGSRVSDRYVDVLSPVTGIEGHVLAPKFSTREMLRDVFQTAGQAAVSEALFIRLAGQP